MNRAAVAQQTDISSSLPPTQGVLQRKCSCGNKTAAIGECSECAKNKIGLQRKLSVGASNDPLEHEADRIADQVMRMSAGESIGKAPPHIQRLTAQTGGQSETAPPSVERVLASSGRSMEPALRQDMEQRFGYDFSQVRFHTGGTAEQSARDVKAHAYTAGHNVVFGTGQFASGTHNGRRLIAHELTHVVQQGGGIRLERSHEMGALSPLLINETHLDRKQSLGAIAESRLTDTATPTIMQRKTPQIVQRLPFESLVKLWRRSKIKLPSGLRFLDPKTEIPKAKSVYGRSIDFGRVLMSNGLGGGGLPFTFLASIPLLGGVTIINAGPGLYNSPGSNRNLLIHELAHSWQSQHHHSNNAMYMVNSVASQAGAAVTGGDAYCYIPGKPFGMYAAEQIAKQAELGVAPIVSHMKSASGVDAANIASLLIPRWEVPGAPGVRC